MEKDQLTRKLAVILHADVVGSTLLVQKNETLAHQRIQAAFNQFSKTIEVYGGVALEIRGDALVAEFSRASDAVSAALLFQQQNQHSHTSMEDDIRPTLRIGISLGEVVSKIASITGSAAAGYENIADVIRTNNPQDLDVYDCVLSAQWFYDNWQEQDHKEARDCLEWAVEQEPGYAEAQRMLASLYIDETKNGFEHRYPDSLERAKRHLENAERIKPDSDGVFYKKALLAYLTECDGYDKFYAAADKAIELNPNNFTLIGDIGNHIGYSGKYERGLALLERAKQLNPRHPKWVYILPMIDRYRTGDYAQAISLYQKMSGGLANVPMIKTLLAAAYARQGEISKAQETINQIIENHPQFEDDPRQPFLARRMEPTLIESVMEGLRAADYDVPPIAKVDRC